MSPSIPDTPPPPPPPQGPTPRANRGGHQGSGTPDPLARAEDRLCRHAAKGRAVTVGLVGTDASSSWGQAMANHRLSVSEASRVSRTLVRELSALASANGELGRTYRNLLSALDDVKAGKGDITLFNRLVELRTALLRAIQGSGGDPHNTALLQEAFQSFQADPDRMSGVLRGCGVSSLRALQRKLGVPQTGGRNIDFQTFVAVMANNFQVVAVQLGGTDDLASRAVRNDANLLEGDHQFIAAGPDLNLGEMARSGRVSREQRRAMRLFGYDVHEGKIVRKGSTVPLTPDEVAGVSRTIYQKARRDFVYRGERLDEVKRTRWAAMSPARRAQFEALQRSVERNIRHQAADNNVDRVVDAVVRVETDHRRAVQHGAFPGLDRLQAIELTHRLRAGWVEVASLTAEQRQFLDYLGDAVQYDATRQRVRLVVSDAEWQQILTHLGFLTDVSPEDQELFDAVFEYSVSGREFAAICAACGLSPEDVMREIDSAVAEATGRESACDSEANSDHAGGGAASGTAPLTPAEPGEAATVSAETANSSAVAATEQQAAQVNRSFHDDGLDQFQEDAKRAEDRREARQRASTLRERDDRARAEYDVARTNAVERRRDMRAVDTRVAHDSQGRALAYLTNAQGEVIGQAAAPPPDQA